MRYDFYHYDEAGAMAIYPEGLHGKSRQEVFDNWLMAIQEYRVLPVGKLGDGGNNVRLVLGELNEQESSEWMGKIPWALKIPDGRLVVEAAFEATEEMFEEVIEDEEIVYFFDIPPGDYQVDVYTYFPTPEYEACLERLGAREPFGQWFRRTRPGTPIPDWLRSYFLTNPREDPENEPYWREIWEAKLKETPYGHKIVEEIEFIEYVIHLQPLTGPFPQLKLEWLFEETWFNHDLNPRKPELCPLGIIYEGDLTS